MADRPRIGALIHLPPEDTVRAFDARGELATTVRWHEMWQADHARAFTVAKVAKLDLLEDIRTSLADVVHNGGTFEEWKARIVPELQRAGWWGRVQDRELTGTDEAITIGPRRLRTIYDTNMRVSRAAGQWARIQERKDVAPYLRYSAIMDTRTRPQHRAWHGTILPVDHPWWDTHFPPCGWNCRCTTMQLSERDLRRHGWTVSAEPPPEGPPSTFVRAGAEQPETVPAGIDPGFAYNPGKASMRAIADRAAYTLQREAKVDLAGARASLRDLVDSPAFLKAMGEPGSAFPVMVLDEDLAREIDADARVAMLSSETFTKQLRRHPELDVALYRKLPDLGAVPHLVVKDGDANLILMKVAGDRWLVAVVKATQTGKGLFVTSVRVQRQAGIRRLLKKGRTIRDERTPR